MSRWFTSDQVGALRVPLHDAGTGLVGQPLGRCQRGGAFVYDPFDAYRAGLVTSPNLLVAGSIGVGKSAFVKMVLSRGLAAGRRAVVLDPKGEYHDLAATRGGRVVTLGAGGRTWCRPFSGERAEDLALVDTLLSASLTRALRADERYVLETTYDEAAATPSSRLLRRLYDQVADRLRESDESPERTLAYALRRFVEGDLVGLFDGEREPDPLDGDFVVLDLSRAWQSDTLALVGLAAMAAARRALAASARPGYLVVDEAWAVLVDERVSHWLHGSWKLARARGVSHVLVLHRWSDAFAAADEGTAQRAKVTGILRDCDTAVLFRQDPGEQALLDDVLALRPLEHAYTHTFGRGQALVRYGAHRSVVRVEPNHDDRGVIDTDQAMRP